MCNCYLYFHQGWTDIINSLSLIHYYSNICNIRVIIRDDAKDIVNFFSKDLLNVEVISYPHYVLDEGNFLKSLNSDKLLFFGLHDVHRRDNFQGAFSKCSDFFVKRFYTAYSLDVKVRIDHFVFSRDIELEQKTYVGFLKKYSVDGKYGLFHHIKRIESEVTMIPLNNSKIFFDYITILENAEEIHVLDSVWANFCYILAAKYNLLKNKPIYVYLRFEEYKEMFEPLPENWKLV